jgi:hypothetical protein
MKHRFPLILVLVPALGAVFSAVLAGQANTVAFQPHPAYALLERLLRVPQGLTVHQYSSHNKKGLNGDANQPLYKDAHGDDVIFDAAGPGCVRSIWGTSFDPAAVLKFYFDGQSEPRLEINEIDFYKGGHPLFPVPLNSYARRGLWGDAPFAGNGFVPIPFEKSLKIAIRGESRFFHVIYEKTPSPAPIATFTGREDRSAIEDAFARLGERPFEGTGLKEYTVESKEIGPGETVPLLKIEKAAGTVREIEIEGDGSEAFFRETQVRLRWDGHPRWDAIAPTGIFFGSPNEADDMRSLPLRVEKLPGGRVRLHCYFPLAFWDKAEIEWANPSPLRFGPIKARIAVGPNAIPRDEGTYFTTLYHAGETVYGHDWLLFEGDGTGWLAGIVQSMRNEHYCEGNERFTIDGAVSPQINGTGSEDYYLACFWPNPDFDTPFGCVIGNIMEKGGGSYPGAYRIPSGYSRFHLEAPIPFYESLRAVIQHGGMSDIRSEYRSLAFVYQRKRAALVQTDSIETGRPESERAHGYRGTPSAPLTALSASPEGEGFETVIRAAGRIYQGGEVSFRIAVDRENQGIRLRRRVDQKLPGQVARVYIDGKFAGVWSHGYGNEFLRWYDLDFDVHPDLTRGKQAVDVKIVIDPGIGPGGFTDFGYRVYSFIK